MSTGRAYYRTGLIVSLVLLMREVAIVHSERADDLEAVDCSDVLAAHGIEIDA